MNAKRRRILQYIAQKALILDASGTKVLLSKYLSSKYLDSKLTGKYCLPGGKITPGADPDQSLRTEVYEETGGVDVRPIIPFYRFSWMYDKNGADIQIVCLVFLCNKVSGRIGMPSKEQETSLGVAEWVNISDVNNRNIVRDEWPAIQLLRRYRKKNPFRFFGSFE